MKNRRIINAVALDATVARGWAWLGSLGTRELLLLIR